MLKGKKKDEKTAKFHVRKDDLVVVLTGEFVGKKGRVFQVLHEKNQVIVEGVNRIKKHVKPGQKVGKGGFLEREGPIHASNVRIFNEEIGKVTRAKIKKLENGEKIRVCAKTGEQLAK